MSKLLNVVNKIDFNALHEQTELLQSVVSEYRVILKDFTENNLDGVLSEDVARLERYVDSFTAIIELNDSLMIAAADENRWQDPTAG